MACGSPKKNNFSFSEEERMGNDWASSSVYPNKGFLFVSLFVSFVKIQRTILRAPQDKKQTPLEYPRDGVRTGQ